MSSPTNVTTGQVRLSYVHLFTPYNNGKPGEEPKYSTTILLPKSDYATKQRIDAAISAAIQMGVASKWGGVRPQQVAQPLWDGDGLRQNGEPYGPEAKGHWVFTASSKHQQAIVDMSMNPIINQTEIYSGIYARVAINFFPYFNSGKKGIGCGLGPVQKLADGEPLGGQISAAEAFAASAGQVYAPQAPPQYAPPVQQYTPPVQQSAPTVPNYGQPVPNNAPPVPNYSQPVQPSYGQPAQPQQQYAQAVDPITGLPLPIPGGVMGI